MSNEKSTREKYWDEIKSLATEALADFNVTNKEAYEENESDIDNFIHESIDGSSWIIYYGNNMDVIQNTDNEDAYEEMGLEGCKGFSEICSRVAYFAMRADAMDSLRGLVEDLPDAPEEEEEEETEEEDQPLVMDSNKVKLASDSIFNAFEDVTSGLFDKARKILSEVKPNNWNDEDLQNVIGTLQEFRNGKIGLEETAQEVIKLIA